MAVKSSVKKKTPGPEKSRGKKPAVAGAAVKSAKKAPAKSKSPVKKPRKPAVSAAEAPRAKKGKPKRKTNLYKLCSEMNRLCLDAVDKEVVKRFKTLIDTSAEEITKTSLHSVLSSPLEADLGAFHESIQPYVKHYVFMVKRAKK
ncbi:MAG TPA: hypothetical protein ENN21_11570 [Spirochaetes bacterium]|nr:hypothetical protein [Spirochaetota bacterium]